MIISLKFRLLILGIQCFTAPVEMTPAKTEKKVLPKNLSSSFSTPNKNSGYVVFTVLTSIEQGRFSSNCACFEITYGVF